MNTRMRGGVKIEKETSTNDNFPQPENRKSIEGWDRNAEINTTPLHNRQHTTPCIEYIDICGGIGGFRAGIERATNKRYKTNRFKNKRENYTNIKKQQAGNNGWKCVFYCDNDKYAVQTYNKNFGENWKPTDITKLSAKEVPKHDLLCAGFPCQSFSIAGKRKGFEDTRGTLFFDICRIVEYHRPALLFLENVKGLLSHDEGQTFTTILKNLDELGYDVEWQVLNSKHFGVPQNRERVFIIGHLRGKPFKQVFPLRESSNSDIIKDKKFSEQISNTIRTNYSTGYSNETYAYCLDANYSKGTRNPEKRERTMILDTNKIRRLTPIECERLQGFSDNWTKDVSDTQRYKQCGNAVTVNVIEAIAAKIIEELQ